MLVAGGVIVYLCLAILQPFANVIAWSSVLAIAFHPVHQRLLQKTHSPALSALISSVLVVVTILLPLLVITALAVNQFLALKEYLARVLSEGSGLAAIEPLRQVSEWLIRRVGLDPQQIVDALRQYATEFGQLAAQYSLAFAANITSAIVSFFFTIFAMFFLFRDGARIVERIPAFLPFERTQSEGVLMRIRDVIYASVYGVLVIAALQGILVGLSFSVLGIPSAALWGVVTLFTSVIPMVGAGAVWVPGALYLLLTGDWLKALVLAVWGAGVISTVDNFLRPRLVGGRVGLSELVMFFSVLGGLQAFGILGLVLGPVIFAIAISLFEVLSHGETEDDVTT